jgi:hypothetical protein
MIGAALNPLLRSGQVAEIRIPSSSGTASGYFDDPEKLYAAAQALDGKVPGIYFTLNPVKPALLARCANRMAPRAKQTTSDVDIVERQYILIDLDPVRPAGISSTDAERAFALTKAHEVRHWLDARGWPLPIEADSGNGAHLLYRVNLPNDAASTQLVKAVLETLALYFTDEHVSLDTTVFNAGRITKLYGSLTCKGDNLPERPHRRSGVRAVPAPVDPVPAALLVALAALRPTDPTPNIRVNGFDLAAWLHEHVLTVTKEKPWSAVQGARVFELEQCPFNPEHLRSARITQFPTGALSFGCFHNSCHGYDWCELRDRLDGPRLGRAAALEVADSSGPVIVLTAAAAIAPQATLYAWADRIPLNAVTITAGHPGLGKTTLILELAARLSRGQLPGALWGIPTASVIASAEDSPAHTLVPRLIAAGGDLALIHFVHLQRDGLPMGVTVPTDLEALKTQMQHAGARLLLLDPLVAHLPATMNSWRDQDVRRALAPLAHFAEDLHAAVVCIVHLNKAQSTDILTRVSGSVGLVAAARSVLLAAENPDQSDHCGYLLAHAKCNLAPLAPTLKYRIETRTVPMSGEDLATSGIVWTGQADGIYAADLMAVSDPQEQGDNRDAAEWLEDLLSHGPRYKQDALQEGKQAGFSPKMLRRARERLKVESHKEGFGGGWAWALPKRRIGDHALDHAHSLNKGTMGTMGTIEDALPLDRALDHDIGHLHKTLNTTTTYNDIRTDRAQPVRYKGTKGTDRSVCPFKQEPYPKHG